MSSRPLFRSAAAALCAAALLAPGSVRAELFPAGSLIIPTQSNYQDACAVVSTYGLVYSVLRANDGLRATPSLASGAWQTPITVHWVYSSSKKSPNRCVPTNLDYVALYKGSNATPITATPGGVWDDGCDFRLNNNAGVPATLVNNANTAVASDVISWPTINTTNSVGVALAYPNFKTRTVKYDLAVGTNVNSLGYSGGAFVISAGDANAFLALLQGTVSTKDKAGNTIDFSPFKSNGASTCAVTASGSRAIFTTTIPGDTGNAFANVHAVNVHRAKVGFTADDNQKINASPPKIGLLQSNVRDFSDENGNSVLTGSGGIPGGVKGTQLRFYLKSAGLDYPAAGGCHPESYNASYVGASPWPAVYNLCGNGKGVSGQIYDNLDLIDIAGIGGPLTPAIPGGLINKLDGSGKPYYQILWAPHWAGETSTIGGVSCDATCIQTALTNIGTFLQDTLHAHGLLAECASIGTLEGSWDSSQSNPDYNVARTETQSLTCQAGADPTKCVTPTPATTPAAPGLKHDMGNTGVYLPNCTDPTTASGSVCAHFANPSSPFSQIGDYKWYAYSGAVGNYLNANSKGAIYRPSGVVPLIYTVNSLNTSTIATDPRSLAQSDNVTFIQRDNSKREAQIIYLGGHNFTPDVAGTRVALNTMLALGQVLDSKPTAFTGPTVYGNTVVTPLYDRITTPGVPVTWTAFDTSDPSAWIFPFHSGTIRLFSLSSLAAGGNSYQSNNTTAAAVVVPAPVNRNVFTYLGARLETDDRFLPPSYRSGTGTGVLQLGWRPVNIAGGSLTDSGCVDVYGIGPVGSGSSTYAGMVPVVGGNGVCDLQESLALSITAADLGSDFGASETSAIRNKLQLNAELWKAQSVLSMVRGFCYSTGVGGVPNLTPTNANCNVGGSSNVTNLGGFVHSQAAVIPASPLIPDAPTGKVRPTMIYAGALDGQLHAFYLASPSSTEVGYTGPATSIAKTLPDNGVNRPSADTVFNTPRSSFPSGLANGTELWSFIPPGQLPLLKDNKALVDSAPAVADVFGDFAGDGQRTWRTVLVASAGGSNREVFALDVTNPLKPTMLWDLQAPSSNPGVPYATSALQGDDTGTGTACVGTCSARAKAFDWQNRCRAVDLGAGTCRPANYALFPAADNCLSGVCGRQDTGLYNYDRLGASQSVSIGTLRRNNAPVFAAFIATNEPNGNGVNVFAIDLVTGQKLWEWNNPFDPTTYTGLFADKALGAGNTPPVGVSIVSRSLDDQINSLYVGDDEGSLWELDASDGRNNTAYGLTMGGGCLSTPGSCNFPLSQAYDEGQNSAQPISTLSTLFVVRPDIPATSVFKDYIGQTLLAYGTAGTDTVSAISTTVNGAVHLLPISPSLRDNASDIKGDTSGVKLTHAVEKGVAYEVAKTKGGAGTAYFPQVLTGGNRIFGSIVADLTTGRLYFGTTVGASSGIDSRGALSGSIYQLDTTVTSGSPLSTVGAATGGVGGTLAMSYDATTGAATLIASTDKDVFVIKPANSTALPPSTTRAVYTLDGSDQGAQGLVGWILRGSGREN